MKSHRVTFIPLLITLGGSLLLVGCGENRAAEGTARTEPEATTTNATDAVAAAGLPGGDTPAALPPSNVPPPSLSPAATEVVQLAQARVGEDVILAFVEASRLPYALKAADIVYLHDLGVSADVIAAMVRRDQELANEAKDAPVVAEAPATNAPPAPAEGAEPEPVSTAAVPAPAEASASPPVAPTGTAPAESVSPPTQTVTYNYFYNTLSPYGTWMEVEDYGWCWQPTVAVVDGGWRPYLHNGRWIWTDSGWYWQSYYSWGWAPFHYGRWHLSSRFGWVWAPDTYWGPAWVTWRYYDGYCGWAPLPPRCIYRPGIGFVYHGRHVSLGFGFGLAASCYSFVPSRHFHGERPWAHCVPHRSVNNFYHRTTVINNYVVGNHNRIVNHGPGTQVFAAASRSEIRKVSLRDIDHRESTTVRGDQIRRDGSLAVYRPRLPEQSSRPPAEVTRRQQEVRRQSEALTHSEPVRQATSTAGSRTIEPRSSNPRREAPAASRPSQATAPARATEPTRRAPTGARSEPAEPSSRSEPTRSPARTEPSRSPARSEPARPAAAPSNRPTVPPATSAPSSRPTESPRRVEPSRRSEPSNSGRRSEPSTSAVAPAPAQVTPAPSRSEVSRSAAPAVPSPARQEPRAARTYPEAAPAPAVRPTPAPAAPGYTAPARREERARSSSPAPSTRSVPSYSPPARSAAPAPSYAPPPAQRSAPAPPPAASRSVTRSEPASAPSRSAPPSSSSGSSRGSSRSRER